MEIEEEATTSTGLHSEARGAGGKFRKPPARKPPSTPYARPPNTRTQTNTRILTQSPETPRTNDGGSTWWFSKLVTPATRLISGGATRLFPSFFSKPSVSSPTSDAEQPFEEAAEDAVDEGPERLPDIKIPRSMEGGKVLLQGNVSEFGRHSDERVGDTLRSSADGTGISEIEQILIGRTFSRDDLNRLTELLQSRIVDQADVDVHAKKGQAMPEGAEEEIRRTSIDEKQAMRLTRVTENISDPLPVTNVLDPVGASPIELAKAYMGSRTLEPGLGSQSIMLKDERTLPATGFSSKSSILSPTPKSSVCWPGAMVQEQLAYLTPQTERNRVGLHNLSRTPYSRPVHSRSTSKLQGYADRSMNISSTQWKQSQTPVYGDNQATRTKISPLDDGFGSVGPIRRTHRKFGGLTTPGRTSLSRPVSSSPYLVERTDASKSFSSMDKQKLEHGASSSGIKFLPGTSTRSSFDAPSSSVGVSTVHPQSSDVARKILEHLDRTIPTPQKKSEELKLATSWRKPSSSQLTTSVLNAQPNCLNVEGSDSHRRSYVLGNKFSDQGKEVRQTSLLNQPEGSKIDEATDAVNTNTLASNTVSSEGGLGPCGLVLNSRPSMEFMKSPDNTHNVSFGLGESSRNERNHPLPRQSQICGQDERVSRRETGLEELNVQKKPPRQTFGNKPALSSISIGQPDPRRTVSFNNGSGFTFPVSASSGSLTEPPTPSILPTFSPSTLPQKEESTNVSSTSLDSKAGGLSYSFGSKTSAQNLVFSFPSASSSSDSEFSAPKFSFGSDKSRISFRSVGEDAIYS